MYFKINETQSWMPELDAQYWHRVATRADYTHRSWDLAIPDAQAVLHDATRVMCADCGRNLDYPLTSLVFSDTLPPGAVSCRSQDREVQDAYATTA